MGGKTPDAGRDVVSPKGPSPDTVPSARPVLPNDAPTVKLGIMDPDPARIRGSIDALHDPAMRNPAVPPFIELPAGARVVALHDPAQHSYDIIERVDGGMMSSAYRARDLLREQDVFLKVFDPGAAPRGALADEMRIIEQCRDLPYVNHVRSSLTDLTYAGELLPAAIVTQWVEGPTLDDLLRSRSVPYRDALVLIEQVARGLESLHSLGIIHRDLKPANIKDAAQPEEKDLWRRHNAVILDFGLGMKLRDKRTDPRDGRMRQYFEGTRLYASPEQYLGLQLSTYTDIYSLGIIGAEFLKARSGAPRLRDHDDIQRMLGHRTLRDFVPPEIPRRGTLARLVSDEAFAYGALREAVLPMLSPDPKDRPSAREVAYALSSASKRRFMFKKAVRWGASYGLPFTAAVGVLVGAGMHGYKERKTELAVRNPVRLERAARALEKGERFLYAKDALEAERLCAESGATLSSYVANSDRAAMRRYGDLRFRSSLCLAESHLQQNEQAAAEAAFAALGGERDDLARVVGLEIARSKLVERGDPDAARSIDAVIAELQRVWASQSRPGQGPLWAGNRLTDALIFKAMNEPDAARREGYYASTLRHAGMMAERFKPEPVIVMPHGGQHVLPSAAPMRPGQMQEYGRALLRKAAVHRRMRQYPQARADIGEALHVAHTLDDRLGVATALIYLGVLEANTPSAGAPNLEIADGVFTAAIAHLRQEGSSGHLADALSKRSQVRNQLSRPLEAYADAHEAAGIYRRFGNVKLALAEARYSEAQILLSFGRISDALSISHDAIPRLVALEDIERAGDYANVILEGQWYSGAGKAPLDEAYGLAMKHLKGFEDDYRHVYADVIYAYGLQETGHAADALAVLERARRKGGYDEYNRGLGAALEVCIVAKAGERQSLDGLIEANGGAPEVLARLYLAQGASMLAAGLPADEVFSMAVANADATKNLYTSLDVRLDIAELPLVSPIVRTSMLDEARRRFSQSSPQYTTSELKGIAARLRR